VRSNIGKRSARLLFAVEKSEMAPPHGFIKKTRQTIPADIEPALNRLKDWSYGYIKPLSRQQF
jgi:phage-related protein